ncbi:MAG: HAD family acid phosphatase [Actinomycetota bacterium]
MSGQATVVLDLDGVLADTTHRMHHLRGRRKDWEGFFAAASHDPAHPEGLALARAAVERGAAVVYLSGRPERLRDDTLGWLRRVGAPDGEVVLRPDGDRRPARVVKLAALRRLATDRRLDVLVDDDPDVVAAVRAARPRVVGEVLLADWQPRDEDLHRAQEVEGRT